MNVSGKWMGLFLVLLWIAAVAPGPATADDVKGHVSVFAASGAPRQNRDVSVVLWLAPLANRANVGTVAPKSPSRARLLQKNKTFEPHVLAVQVGSEVDFPNRDPFFHNVFSLFNGKRFDLGLYEAGSTRGVRFDRPGVCYIFCNIHPQMSAVVVVVDTPLFAVSDANGDFVLSRVPPGQYQFNVWEEHCAPEMLRGMTRRVAVDAQGATVGRLRLQESNAPATAHLNKYGKQYDPQVFSSPLYLQP